MNKFLTYDWAAMEAAMDAGDTTPNDEKAALGKLMHIYKLRKMKEREQAEAAARLRAKKDAAPNTPVYYTGSTKDFFARNVKWMLKTGDGRKYMKVQVLFKSAKSDKEAVTWQIHYNNISLDWRAQTDRVNDVGGFRFSYKVSDKPW